MKGLLLAIAVAAVLAIWTSGVRADDLRTAIPVSEAPLAGAAR